MLISFIIPCYNSAPYIGRCIDSVYNQKIPLDDFEVIIVNDGSSDSSLDVIGAYQYRNIKVLNQSNQGLSDARNNGLDMASGTYVWFVDSDDYIKGNVTLSLIDKAKHNKLDILCFGMEIHNDDVISYDKHAEVINDEVLNGEFYIQQGYNPNSACAVLYRREFLKINNLRFYTRLYHQDVEFNYRAVCMAKRVMFISETPYVYDKHPNTISTSQDIKKKIKRLIDNGIIAKSFMEFATKQGTAITKKVILKKARSISLGTFYQLFKSKEYSQLEIVSSVVSKFVELGLFPLTSPTLGLKHLFATSFFNIYYKRFVK